MYNILNASEMCRVIILEKRKKKITDKYSDTIIMEKHGDLDLSLLVNKFRQNESNIKI